jgi:hypothetical protein
LKIELHKQFKVPVTEGGLIPIAEEVDLKKEKKKDRLQAFKDDSS